jgi:uncharacterized protein YbbK (DUF523 family)
MSRPPPGTRLAALRRDAQTWPDPTLEPWPVLFSGCLAGLRCGVDGSDNGPHPLMTRLLALPTIRPVPFCPEDLALGTPRGLPDLHGGDGFDALDGRARVLLDDGRDVTEALARAASVMVETALRERVRLAVLMDMSAACGTQVISDGARGVPHRRYRVGFGVAAAALFRAGVPVVAQRDLATLDTLLRRIDPTGPRLDEAVDHHEREWYRQTFGPTPD